MTIVSRSTGDLGTSETAAPVVNIPILLYHSIDRTADARYRPYAVPPELFARHMRALRDCGYRTCSTTELLGRRAETANLRRIVGLTFDDGFRDFLTGAYPILRKHGFSATLYVVSGYVGGASRWLERIGEGERPMLSWRELREVNQGGIECGAHTVTHPQLDIMPQKEAFREISDSKRALEDGLGCAVQAFAYPHGYASKYTRELVRAAGFTSACRVRNALSSSAQDPFSLSRIMVTPELQPDGLLALVRGVGPKRAHFAGGLPELLWRLARRTGRML